MELSAMVWFDKVVCSEMLDSTIFNVFSNLNDSMNLVGNEFPLLLFKLDIQNFKHPKLYVPLKIFRRVVDVRLK